MIFGMGMRRFTVAMLAGTALAAVSSAAVGQEATPAAPDPMTLQLAAPVAMPEAAPFSEGVQAPVAAVVPPAVVPAVVATPAVVAAAPLPVVPAADIALAIGALVSRDQSTLSFQEKKQAAAIQEFYLERGDLPAWVENGAPSARASAVLTRLTRAAEDGLDLAELALPDPASLQPNAVDIATFDVALTSAIATFARYASAGRVVPTSIYKDITRKPEPVDPIASLIAVAGADDTGSVLDGFNPPHEQFKRLKQQLATVRAQVAEPRPEPIADGVSLKPGRADPRVAAIRDRLMVAAPADPLLGDVYDNATVEAVKVFQARNGLTADGVVGARTLAALNGGDSDVEGTLLANLEMWRWMPRDLGPDHVFVNVPEFMAHVVRNGREVHETRVIVGKVVNQTPIFSAEMQYLVVNPFWHVPESIKVKEMLPEIQADPVGYFQRHGYEATWEGMVIDPASVVWDENAVKAVGIRQVPGEANALGNIKFMFPNKHAVYLHDTPSRKLFGRDYRAFSHGCVRVDDPMAFAEAILQGDPSWTVPKLEAMFGGAEQRVDLTRKLKVHIAYFNAWVESDGTLRNWEDLYGHVKRIKVALGR